MNHFVKTARRVALAAAITLTSVTAFATPINSIDNAGFDAPTQAATGYKYLSGTVNGWTYTGTSGVATNGSGFGVAGATGQVGFLQEASSISQTFMFTGTNLMVSFLAESRAYSGNGNNISVLIDNVLLTFAGATTIKPTTITSFTQYMSDVVSLSAGAHTLSFVGYGTATGADVTTFIDSVVLTTDVPEPVTLGLFGLGLVALGATRRKAKQA